MTRRTDKLYLIRIRDRAVALIPDKDPLEAINRYITKTGFDSDDTYLSSYLMTNTIEFTTRLGPISRYYFITTITKTISGDHLRIDSYEVECCNDIFKMADPKDINNPLFIRPTIKEARKCVGFSYVPEYELRKFCI